MSAGPKRARALPGPASRAASVSSRLARSGLKRSAARSAVMEAFFACEGHVTVDDLLPRARAILPGVGPSTVYRTMRLLVEHGEAVPRDFGGGHTRFEASSGHHHDHLLCTRCGAVREFEDEEIEQLQRQVARRFGFEIDSHRLELYGRCAACRGADARATARTSGRQT
jgi:Fur family transcriptional regulator, ferric uptake regulator